MVDLHGTAHYFAVGPTVLDERNNSIDGFSGVMRLVRHRYHSYRRDLPGVVIADFGNGDIELVLDSLKQ